MRRPATTTNTHIKPVVKGGKPEWVSIRVGVIDYGICNIFKNENKKTIFCNGVTIGQNYGILAIFCMIGHGFLIF